MPYPDERQPPTTPMDAPCRDAGGITSPPAWAEAAGTTPIPHPTGGNRGARWV